MGKIAVVTDSNSGITQEQAKEFYKKQGYQEYGDTDSEQGCPHIWMYKNLSSKKRHF